MSNIFPSQFWRWIGVRFVIYLGVGVGVGIGAATLVVIVVGLLG